jgi:hypothetical protein
MIRGQKLINEIDNYFIINNKYPNNVLSIDPDDILNIYKKVFPNENFNIMDFPMNFPQPHYQGWDNSYTLNYMLGWSDLFVWEWLFGYDSSTKRWEIGHMQYAPNN